VCILTSLGIYLYLTIGLGSRGIQKGWSITLLLERGSTGNLLPWEPISRWWVWGRSDNGQRCRLLAQCALCAALLITGGKFPWDANPSVPSTREPRHSITPALGGGNPSYTKTRNWGTLNDGFCLWGNSSSGICLFRNSDFSYVSREKQSRLVITAVSERWQIPASQVQNQNYYGIICF